MSALCPCGEPSGDGFLGRACSRRLERALRDLPALIADLDITLTRQGVTGAHSEGKPTKKDAQPLSLNLSAADVAHDLRHTLVSAIRHLTQARGITQLPKDDPTSMAKWLLRHHDSIRLDPAGPDIADAIHAVTARIWAVIGPEPDIRIKVGKCPETVDGSLCPGGVWASIPREGPATMECRYCGTGWPAIEWERVGDRILKRGAA
jgi:hypothetical protein